MNTIGFDDFRNHQWQNFVDPLDLFILRQLCDGIDIPPQDPKEMSKFQETVKAEFGIELSKEETNQRIKWLIDNKILLKARTALPNPMVLYDYVFIIFLKLHLSSVISQATTTWDVATKNILEVSNRHGNPIKMLFTALGWGDYDLIAFAYVDDLAKYYEFQKELTQTGFIEKFDTKMAHEAITSFFEPIAVPDYKESLRLLSQAQKTLGKLNKLSK